MKVAAGVWSVLVLPVAACGHSGTPGAAAPLAAPDVTVRGDPAPAEPLTISVGGRDRTILVHAPVQTTGPVPLVLNLHGSRFTAGEQEKFSGMDSASDAYGFVVAYPQAAIPSGTGFEWHVPGQPLLGGRPAPEDAPDDVAFLGEALSAIEQRVAIDPNRVFATGFSGGARMVSQLACDLSEKIAAVAPVGGLRFPSPCDGRHPVSVIAFHGTADPVNPYEVPQGERRATWTYGVREAAEQWAAHDGCGASVVDTDPAPGARLTTYTGCRGGAAVELYTIENEGHEWPGGPVMPADVTKALGPQSNVIDANPLMWAFFSAHPRP